MVFVLSTTTVIIIVTTEIHMQTTNSTRIKPKQNVTADHRKEEPKNHL
jgi:hypothetical protein